MIVMSDLNIPTPESIVRQFTLEQMQELFQEIGHAVSADEMKLLKQMVEETNDVELAFRNFLATRSFSSDLTNC